MSLKNMGLIILFCGMAYQTPTFRPCNCVSLIVYELVAEQTPKYKIAKTLAK
jgi:hypothetical protein